MQPTYFDNNNKDNKVTKITKTNNNKEVAKYLLTNNIKYRTAKSTQEQSRRESSGDPKTQRHRRVLHNLQNSESSGEHFGFF